MKNSKRILLLLLIGSTMVVSSCKKKSPTPAPVVPPVVVTPAFSASVNGTTESWNTGPYYQLLSGGTYINGFTGTQQKIQLVITNAQVAGTYTIGTFVMAYYWDATNSMHSASSGTITISSISGNKIAGSFSFATGTGYTLTSGSFSNVPLQ